MLVRFFAYIRDYTHTKETEIEKCETVEELLKKLCSMYGREFEKRVFEEGQISSGIIVLVNGRHICHCDGGNTKLEAADEISIFPVVAGG